MALINETYIFNYSIHQVGEDPVLETDELLEEEESKLALLNIEIEKQSLLKKRQLKEQALQKQIEARVEKERQEAELREKHDACRERIAMEDRQEEEFQEQTNGVLANMKSNNAGGDDSVMQVLTHYQSKYCLLYTSPSPRD